MHKLILPLALLLPVTGVEAADWRPLAAGRPGTRLEYDAASVERYQNLVRLWERETFDQRELGPNAGFYFKTRRSLMQYDCQSRSLEWYVQTYAADDGSEIKTLRRTPEDRSVLAVPDSAIERRLSAVCALPLAKRQPAPATNPGKDAKTVATPGGKPQEGKLAEAAKPAAVPNQAPAASKAVVTAPATPAAPVAPATPPAAALAQSALKPAAAISAAAATKPDPTKDEDGGLLATLMNLVRGGKIAVGNGPPKAAPPAARPPAKVEVSDPHVARVLARADRGLQKAATEEHDHVAKVMASTERGGGILPNEGPEAGAIKKRPAESGTTAATLNREGSAAHGKAGKKRSTDSSAGHAIESGVKAPTPAGHGTGSAAGPSMAAASKQAGGKHDAVASGATPAPDESSHGKVQLAAAGTKTSAHGPTLKDVPAGSNEHTPDPHAKPSVVAGHAVESKPVEANPREAKVPTRWEYQGTTAPERWSELSPEYEVCGSGRRQAPIDIRGAVRADLEPLRTEYRAVALRALDTGRMIQVNYEPGSFLYVGDMRYELTEFHFHAPAETLLNGKRHELEIHLVHRSRIGKTAILSVLVRKGEDSPLLHLVSTYLPLQKHKEKVVPVARYNAKRLLPERRTYYIFSGSLTTPPCSEDILWLVMKEPIQASASQIGRFTTRYANNARPVQALNSRLIKESE